MRAKLEVSITSVVEVEVTQEEFDEIVESTPICEDDLPEGVQAQLDPSKMTDHVESVEIVGIEDDSPEARERRRAARKERDRQLRDSSRSLSEGERTKKKTGRSR